MSKLVEEMDLEDLKLLNSILRERLTVLKSDLTRSFKTGDKVYFKTKQNQRIEGIIRKVNQKTISVDTPEGRWKVSSILLNHITNT